MDTIFNGYKELLILYFRGQEKFAGKPDNAKTHLIQSIVDENPILQSLDHVNSILTLLVGNEKLGIGWMESTAEEEGFMFPYFRIKHQVSLLTTKHFLKYGLTVFPFEIKKLQETTTKLVDKFIYSHFISSVLKKRNAIADLQYELTYRVWVAFATHENDPSISFKKIKELAELKSSLAQSLNLGQRMGPEKLKTYFLKIEQFKSSSVSSEDFKIYQTAIDSILKYAIHRHIDLFRLHKANGEYFTPSDPYVSNWGLRILSKDPEFSKVLSLLEKTKKDFQDDIDTYVHIRYKSLGFSKLDKRLVHNKGLVLTEAQFKVKKTEFFTELKKNGLIEEITENSPNLPAIIKELFRLSEDMGLGDHELLADKFQDSPLFLGSEVPLYQKIEGISFAGQPDGLFYDFNEENKFITLVDFKPNYRAGDTGTYSFANAIPQAAAAALILQFKTGIRVKCVIFNDGEAILFDPNNILQEFNQFMTSYIPNRPIPWLKLLKLIPNNI
ncbi:hypothetical protein LCGC14_0835170 [marine sediment metagenome]|uniref:Uncharacterized protein n=1 Tax=marine sediment metagenome TaxID=412755 RepID=A0A0F9Q032_9ZZZZ|nr:hypothetical protein [bacterium]